MTLEPTLAGRKYPVVFQCFQITLEGAVVSDQTSKLSFECDPRKEPPVLPPSKEGRVREGPAPFDSFVRY